MSAGSTGPRDPQRTVGPDCRRQGWYVSLQGPSVHEEHDRDIDHRSAATTDQLHVRGQILDGPLARCADQPHALTLFDADLRGQGPPGVAGRHDVECNYRTAMRWPT